MSRQEAIWICVAITLIIYKQIQLKTMTRPLSLRPHSMLFYSLLLVLLIRGSHELLVDRISTFKKYGRNSNVAFCNDRHRHGRLPPGNRRRNQIELLAASNSDENDESPINDNSSDANDKVSDETLRRKKHIENIENISNENKDEKYNRATRRIKNLESLVASQAVDIQRLKAQLGDVSEVVKKFESFMSLLDKAGLNLDDEDLSMIEIITEDIDENDREFLEGFDEDDNFVDGSAQADEDNSLISGTINKKESEHGRFEEMVEIFGKAPDDITEVSMRKLCSFHSFLRLFLINIFSRQQTVPGLPS